MKPKEIQLQREFFEREEKLKEEKARRESLKDPSQKSRSEEERRERMIQMLLNKDQSEFPFLEIEPCINQVSLQVQLVTRLKDYQDIFQ